MAELLVCCESEDLTKDILLEVVKSLAKNDTTHETVGVKNISAFLETVSEKSAKTLQTQLPSVVQLLDCEAYQLRNAAVTIMSNIVIHVFVPQEDSDDADTRLRFGEQKMQVIRQLMARTRDKCAFSRTKALHAMMELVDRNLVGQALHLEFLRVACARIKDVASNVRKKAMQLLWKEVRVFASVIFREDGFLEHKDVTTAVETNRKSLEALEKRADEFKAVAPPAGKNQSEPMHIEGQAPAEEKKAEEDDDSLGEERQRLIAILEFYELYDKFLILIDGVVPCLTQLLGSKNSSDVMESIKVLTELYQRRVLSALVPSCYYNELGGHQEDDRADHRARKG